MKGKILKEPSPLSYPAEGEKRIKKEFNRIPSPLPSPAKWRGLKKLRWKGTEGV
jgi:hypothetical protein